MSGWEPAEAGAGAAADAAACRVPAAVARGALGRRRCARIAARALRAAAPARGGRRSVGIHLSAYAGRGGEYFADAVAANAALRRALGGGPDPRGEAAAALLGPGARGTRPAEEGGRQYADGAIRVLDEGAGCPLHRDCARFDAPGFSVSRHEVQLSCVACLAAPPAGGELVVYRREWEEADERHRDPGFGYAEGALRGRPEAAAVRLGAGDAALFNPRLYHRVSPPAGGPRVALCAFLGLGGPGGAAERWA